MSDREWAEEWATNEVVERGAALAEVEGIAAFDKLIVVVNELEVRLLHAPTREGGHAERALIARFAAMHPDGHRVISDMATRDWAATGAPTLFTAWKNSVEHGVLNWAARWGDAPTIDIAEDHFYATSADEAHVLWGHLASRYCETGRDLTLLGHRQREPMAVAQHWAAELGRLDPRLADPRDIPALSSYLQRAQAAGYEPLSHVRAALEDSRPLGERPAQTLMYRLAGSFDPQRIAQSLGSQWVAQQLDDAGMDLPGGYRLAASGVPGVAPKYQLLRDTGHDEQFVGMRDSRAEAAGLAHLHHSRLRAERATTTNPTAPAPSPRR